ncbi:subtilisin-like protease SBT1.7 [Cocos nucifera]|uniref:Subtilisin-like protease SBT1.7 n=1 Tax=Cocos nucifera TaxID=13894 RepID=A0A8K0I892_COCNU|nr:subtilisin-like protease SBT1.7 [Cocos nucifera]
MEIHKGTGFSLLAFFLACIALVPARSQLLPVVDPVGGNGSQIQTYIVHVYLPEDTELLGAEQLEKWHKSFLPNTTLDSGDPRLVYSYHSVIGGFAARLTHDEVKAMEKMEGFVSARPEQHLRLGTTYTPKFLGLDQYNGLCMKSRQGEGVIIGVLDSGIVPTHPSFDADGMPEPPLKWRGCCEFSNTSCNKWVPKPCNNKLIGAAAFGFSRTPDDEIGHGTHVAGIAAGSFVHGAQVMGQAKGTAAGVAPRAHLAVYKVCHTLYHKTSCSDTSILEGIEKAIDDGVDVLSMSIFVPGVKIHHSSIAKGSFRAMEKGIISVCCAGNHEERGPSVMANDAPWILTVGASSIDRVARATVRLGNGMEFDGESAYQPANISSSTMMPIAYPGAIGTDVTKACQAGAFNGMNITGKIVLCGQGLNDPINKGELVKAAGGAALVVLNQFWNNFTIKSEPHVIPAAHLNHQDSLKVVNYFLTEVNPTATIFFKGTLYGARRAPAVASFSSRGPSLVNGGILKPDIIGPGVDILSAWHEEVGPNPSGETDKIFNFAFGCSMATPHLAGVAALLNSSHPDWSPAAIKSAIMTTAHTLDREGKPITDELSGNMDPASVFAMGAGHVDPSKANDPGLIYDIRPEEYIGYLCGGLKYSKEQLFEAVGRQIQCSNMKNIEADQLNLPSISVNLGKSSTLNKPGVTYSKRTVSRTVTNVGEANSVFSLKVDEPEGVSVKVNPRVLQFSGLNEEKSYTVEFSTDGKPPGKYSEGQLCWISNKHVVRSPISVTF